MSPPGGTWPPVPQVSTEVHCPCSQFCSQYHVNPFPMLSLYFSLGPWSPSLYFPRVLVCNPSILPVPGAGPHFLRTLVSRPPASPQPTHRTAITWSGSLQLPRPPPPSLGLGVQAFFTVANRLRCHRLHVWLRLWLVGCACRDHLPLPVRGHGLDGSSLLSSAGLRLRSLERGVSPGGVARSLRDGAGNKS